MSEQNLPSSDALHGQISALLEQLRQHVGNLMAAAHLLTPAVRAQGEEKYDQCLAIMNQSHYCLLRIINHIDLSRNLNAGDQPFRPVSLDLAGLCRETAEEVAALAKLVGVTFRYESEFTSLLTTGDSFLLQRLLLGLSSHAMRTAGNGGLVTLSLTQQKGRAVLSVSPSDEDDDSDAIDGSLGLGLSIARELAALHGGTLILERGSKLGPRVILSLPIHPPEPGLLRNPDIDRGGGFSSTLVELSDLLPYEAFLPEDVE